MGKVAMERLQEQEQLQQGQDAFDAFSATAAVCDDDNEVVEGGFFATAEDFHFD